MWLPVSLPAGTAVGREDGGTNEITEACPGVDRITDSFENHPGATTLTAPVTVTDAIHIKDDTRQPGDIAGL